MSREKLTNTIGIGLLLTCFFFALGRVLNRGSSASTSDGRTVVRFAHWQLEGGVREALDHLARDYEALHPEVKIEQVPVPERTYAQWVKTQLVGGTATDIIQLGRPPDEEMIARFFVPLTPHVEQPNPYNRETPLEGIPWRETFIDGMQAGWNYRPSLNEYHGISVSTFTIRIFYNRNLWRSLLGDHPIPADYDAFVSTCRQVSRMISAGAGRAHLIPIAGSKTNGPVLIDRLFASQTQKLQQRLDIERVIKVDRRAVALALLRGDWTVDDPAFVAGMELAREAGLFMQDGFTHAGREDATFYFLQQRALMIATGSWDATSFRSQATFEIGVFDIPIPSSENARYGHNVLGPATETETETGLAFGITRLSPNYETALDFLHYITSQKGNADFSAVSGWLPSVVGVEVSEHARPFLPRQEGYVDGFDAKLSKFGADTVRLVDNNLNLLVSRSGSVDAFIEHMRTELPKQLRQDLERGVRNALRHLQRQDTVLAACHMLETETPTKPGDPPQANRLGELFEAQNQQEASRAWTLYELHATAR